MADGIQFDIGEIKALGLQPDIAEEINKAISTQLPKIVQIQQMGQQLENMFNRFVVYNSAGGFGDFALSRNTSNDNDLRTLMVLGAQYIFNLRNFLLDDSINFILGGTYIDDNGQSYLGERNLSQEEMLRSIRGSLSQKAVVLNHNLEQLKTMEKVRKSDISDLWNIIQNAADLTGDYKTGEEPAITIDDHPYYWSDNVDTFVMIRFDGSKRTPGGYYALGGSPSDPQYFNNGWLYEWLKAKTTTDQEIENMRVAINGNKEHPLTPVIGTMDNVAGIKGGDFSLGQGQGSAQAKFGNNRIISFSGVIMTIKEINIILSRATGQIRSGGQELATKLFNLFVDESLVSSLSRSASGTLDYILDQLKGLT